MLVVGALNVIDHAREQRMRKWDFGVWILSAKRLCVGKRNCAMTGITGMAFRVDRDIQHSSRKFPCALLGCGVCVGCGVLSHGSVNISSGSEACGAKKLRGLFANVWHWPSGRGVWRTGAMDPVT